MQPGEYKGDNNTECSQVNIRVIIILNASGALRVIILLERLLTSCQFLVRRNARANTQVHAHIHTFALTHIHTLTHTHANTHKHKHSHTHSHIHTPKLTNTNKHTHTHIYK
jgi:ABC-type nickel/cobalt efflux system permease component RcnA